MTEPSIVIPVGDWVDEYQEVEPDLSTEEKAIGIQQKAGYGPAKMGRLLAIGKLRNEVFDEAPEHKPLHNLGWAHWWSRRLANRRETVKLESGKEIEVNALVCPVRETYEPEDRDDDLQMAMSIEMPPPKEPPESPDDVDDDPAAVAWNDPLALPRAQQYLRLRVPGYIYNRFKLIAANGGNVWEAAQELHAKIDELAARLA